MSFLSALECYQLRESSKTSWDQVIFCRRRRVDGHGGHDGRHDSAEAAATAAVGRGRDALCQQHVDSPLTSKRPIGEGRCYSPTPRLLLHGCLVGKFFRFLFVRLGHPQYLGGWGDVFVVTLPRVEYRVILQS